ncbi:MAG: histidine ammonia-lyase [Candidatus Marinimicrobia bacterium]|nr:histidine ammonia-lyase [Candidatus Neomarinimicrobiota bacterium]
MLRIDGNSLTLNDVVRVARESENVALAKMALPGIIASRNYVLELLEQKAVVYGITTGVGELSTHYIPPEEAIQLQENLIRSHAANVGEPLEKDTVRAMILLRANALSKGYSGVRVELINTLLELLNKNIYPYIPAKGSVGASGDLSPLAHLALILTGQGECLEDGKRIPAMKVLRAEKITPLQLQAKEGLALINGTQVMAAHGCLTLCDAYSLIKHAQIAGAMSLEALKGTSSAMDARIHAARPHAGQSLIAKNIRELVKDSAIMASHVNCDKVQDAYTLRCMPQVYGAVHDTLEYVKSVFETEINSATDNPLIFAEDKDVISGGNFHGEPLAFALDFLGIVLAEIANISERTVDRLVNPHVSGLPPFLAEGNGLNSGYMIAQYTAAALVSENKILAHPASVDSIPTSAGQEDHVSMGSISAEHARAILKNVVNVLAIEMLSATQGIDFQQPLEPGTGTKAAWVFIRKHIPHWEKDRIMYKDIEIMADLIRSEDILKAVENEGIIL